MLQTRAPRFPSTNTVTVTHFCQHAYHSLLRHCRYHRHQRPFYKMPGRPREHLKLCVPMTPPASTLSFWSTASAGWRRFWELRTTVTAQCRETGIQSPNNIPIYIAVHTIQGRRQCEQIFMTGLHTNASICSLSMWCHSLTGIWTLGNTILHMQKREKEAKSLRGWPRLV